MAKRYEKSSNLWHDCAVKRYHKSANLFDMSAVTPNSLLNRETGAVISASSLYAVTDFIPVEGGSYSYSLNDYGGYLGGANVVFYDAQKEYISGDWIRWVGDPEKSMTIEVPAGIAYMRIDTITDPPPESAQQMINRGTQMPYEPYSGEAWHDTEEHVWGRYPNIYDVDSVQSIIRNNVATTDGFSNVDGVITLTKSVGNDGRYAYNRLLSFEVNEVYEIAFDVLLEGTNSSNFISIAVLNPSNMGAVSTDLFNYSVEKDTWVNVAEELTLSATQGTLSIQARNTGNSVKIKNVILRKKGYTWNKQQ